MIKFLLAFLFPLLLDLPAPPPLSNRVSILFDVSHSMSQDLGESIKIIKGMSETPTDDMEIKVRTFAEIPMTWPFDWLKLPANDEQAKKARDWVSHQWPRGGHTFIQFSLLSATQEDKEDVTVVIFTDGVFHDGTETIKKIVDKSKHPIIFVLINPDEKYIEKYIVPILKEGKVGAMIIKTREEEDDE